MCGSTKPLFVQTNRGTNSSMCEATAALWRKRRFGQCLWRRLCSGCEEMLQSRTPDSNFHDGIPFVCSRFAGVHNRWLDTRCMLEFKKQIKRSVWEACTALMSSIQKKETLRHPLAPVQLLIRFSLPMVQNFFAQKRRHGRRWTKTQFGIKSAEGLVACARL